LRNLYIAAAALALVHYTSQVIVYGLCRVPVPLLQVGVRSFS
jgi:hypothetical protein